MSQLNRQTPRYTERTRHPRYIAPADVPVARDQAYIMRDLIQEHHGMRLRGGDVTDVFSLVFHDMDWATLRANERGESRRPYYGAQSQDAIAPQADMLRELLGLTTGSPTVRVLLDMPRQAYCDARTLAGARLATLLAGDPSWTLNDASASADGPLIYDARTDRGYLPMHFSSDPSTNAERVHAVHPKSREEVDIPIELVRYVRFSRLESEVKDDYVLTEHTRSEDAAKSFYGKDGGHALSYELARRWYNAGNGIKAVVFHSGNKSKLVDFDEWDWHPVADRDFDRTIRLIRDHYGMGNIVLMPIRLDEVRDPAERWKPSFKHSRLMLPKVEAAEAKYLEVLEALPTMDKEGAVVALRKATLDYNEVLERALDSIWQDTREINRRDTLFKAYATTDRGNELFFKSINPLQVIREWIGESGRTHGEEQPR